MKIFKRERLVSLSGNKSRKKLVFLSSLSRDKCVKSLFFSASSERFKKYRFLRCKRYAPTPIAVKIPQGILKNSARENPTPRKRKRTVESKNAVKKVNKISERKAVFFIFTFLTVFLRFNLEKKRNILYNVV